MVIILRLRNKIILYTFILLCFLILSYSIYNIVVWKLDSNNTNKQIEEVQETVKVEEVIDTENTEIIEPVEEMIIVIDSIILVFLFTIYHQIYSNKIIVKSYCFT